jgi:SAM-dependent methyltransferase
MSEAVSLLATPGTWDLVADAYAVEVVPVFESFASRALDLASVGPGTRTIDVAAGPGTLSVLAARRGALVSALDFSPRMVEMLRARARDEGLDAIDATQGDGMALPFEDGAFDAGFSMFGLMFFPDREAGFKELRRVLQPGSRAVVSSWIPFERLELFSTVFTALGAVTPAREEPAPRRPFALSEPSLCLREMSAAGFREVEVHEHTAPMRYESTSAMLDSMIRTNAPLKIMQRELGASWAEIERAWRGALETQIGAGPQAIEMTALLTVGVA